MGEKTAAQRGRMVLARSKADERAVAAYYRETGLFPRAERAVRTGFKAVGDRGADPGDICQTPGVITSVKSWEDPVLVERSIPAWLEDLGQMQAETPGPVVRLLVVRRFGKTDVGSWWCFQQMQQFLGLAAPCSDPDHVGHLVQPVRTLLRDVVPLLHARGYGVPDDAQEAS